MSQELQDILINIGWLAFSIGILFGVPVTLIGVYYYKTSKRFPPDDVFRWCLIISVFAFGIAFALWILAWIF